MEALASEWQPELSWLVQVDTPEEFGALERIAANKLGSFVALVSAEVQAEVATLPAVFAPQGAFRPGDVVAVAPKGNAGVLYREADEHHTIFLTNRCNSLCLMCSQPPTKHDDSWLVAEAKEIATHIRRSPTVLGFTGGEPLLLREQLREVLEAFIFAHPRSHLEVLTNGRLFQEKELARALLRGLSPQVGWAIPLYGHADFVHDYVVQSQGAFDETLDGLLTLHQYGQPIQLRIVLLKPTLTILPALANFIALNLPFVQEVALMGCEPIGFALANADICMVDLRDWMDELRQAIRRLVGAQIRPVLMNLPLCALPADLRPLAHRSISDWKQVYSDECASCAARQSCCGLFASHTRGWRPTVIQPIREVAEHEAV